MSPIISSIKRRPIINALDLKLRRSRGDLLQHFLAAVAVKAWGDNFIPATAHYTQGDLKCDGLLQDPLTIFACYGPTNGGDGQSDGATAQVVAKVSEDFEGALKKWPELKAWVFVNSYVQGIPPQITAKILKLQKANLGIAITQLGIAKFEALILAMDIEGIEDLLGEAASESDFRALQIPEVQQVVEAVMAKVAISDPGNETPVVVPADKLDFNKLAAPNRGFIKLGLQNSARVENYLLNNYIPTLGGDLAKIFRDKYLEFKIQHLSPDEIMDELFGFAVSGQKLTASRTAAVWSLLAYLFEKCTIFEDHTVDAVTTQ